MSQSHKPDARAGLFERHREIRRDRRFADAAFAAGDRDDVLDAFECASRQRRPCLLPAGGMDIDQDRRLAHAGSSRKRRLRIRL